MDELNLAPLPLEDEATRQKRHDVAEAFFYAYIIEGVSNEDMIDVIAELICYGGDLDEITQKMALVVE